LRGGPDLASGLAATENRGSPRFFHFCRRPVASATARRVRSA